MKKKLISALLATACCCVAFTGCTSFDAGTVIDKEHRAAYTTHTFIKSGYAHIPVAHHHPESWQLKIQDDVDGETVTDWVTVSETEYESYEIGDYYSGIEESSTQENE